MRQSAGILVIPKQNLDSVGRDDLVKGKDVKPSNTTVNTSPMQEK